MRNRTTRAITAFAERRGKVDLRDLCCWPECHRSSSPFDAPLCTEHLIQSWRIVHLNAEGARELATKSMFGVSLNFRLQAEPLTERPPGVVYFVKFRDRIKIGYTTNMIARMDAIPHDEVLGIAPGVMADEKRCHQAFAHLRDLGEWFRPEPELLAFIADVSQVWQGRPTQ